MLCGKLCEIENVELKMMNRGSFWGEAPFHLLQPVLLGVLTGLVWMVLGIFACRANVWACFLAAMGVGVW